MILENFSLHLIYWILICRAVAILNFSKLSNSTTYQNGFTNRICVKIDHSRREAVSECKKGYLFLLPPI